VLRDLVGASARRAFLAFLARRGRRRSSITTKPAPPA